MTRLAGEVALAAEISDGCACHKQARHHAAVVAAGRDEVTGKVLVDLAPFYGHPRGAVAKLAHLVTAHDPVAVVIDPRSQAGTLLQPLAEAGVQVLEPSTADVVAAHGGFLDLVNDGGLMHLDQPPLTAAVRAAQQRPLAGAQAWERRLAVDQSPLVAATLATWAFLSWERLAAPGAWVL
jgi:hypothetical protein